MNIDSIINNFYISRIVYIIFFVFLSIGVIKDLKEKNLNIKNKINIKNINIKFILIMILLTLTSRIILELVLPFIFKNTESNSNSLQIGQFIMEFISICICAPICEEIIFRFGLYEYLNKKVNVIFSIIITSILFSIFHLYSLDGVIILFIVSIIWNYSYYKTNNLIYPILLHFIFNFYALII